jgi:cytochrome P450
MKHARATLPPGPSSLIATSLRYLRDPYGCVARVARRFGDPFTVPTVSGPLVCSGDPLRVQAFFGADPDAFEPFGIEAATPILGAGSLFLVSGARHRRARKLLMPPFHGEHMRAYGETMRQIAATRAREWPTGRAFSVEPLLRDISLDVIIETIFGVTGRERVAAFHAAIIEGVKSFTPLIAMFTFLRRELGGIGPWARFQKRWGALKRSIADELEARRSSGVEANDVLSLLLGARYDDGRPMDDEELIAQLLTLVVAGHETTATALAWALHFLHRDPELAERVRVEASGAASPDAIARLPLLDAVCWETLRIRPLVPIVARRAVAPMTFAGYELPAGTGVGAVASLVHAREDLYPEPERFRPERFLERSFAPHELLPFGGGARRCLGAAFALYEMKIVLATLLAEHRFRLADDRPVRADVRAATVGPKGGVSLIAIERAAA